MVMAMAVALMRHGWPRVTKVELVFVTDRTWKVVDWIYHR